LELFLVLERWPERLAKVMPPKRRKLSTLKPIEGIGFAIFCQCASVLDYVPIKTLMEDCIGIHHPLLLIE
jgi:hypothetical protein